jgi:hypothetical protein
MCKRTQRKNKETTEELKLRFQKTRLMPLQASSSQATRPLQKPVVIAYGYNLPESAHDTPTSILQNYVGLIILK